jgi:hypothetical protein
MKLLSYGRLIPILPLLFYECISFQLQKYHSVSLQEWLAYRALEAGREHHIR